MNNGADHSEVLLMIEHLARKLVSLLQCVNWHWKDPQGWIQGVAQGAQAPSTIYLVREFEKFAIFPHKGSGHFNRGLIDATTVCAVNGDDSTIPHSRCTCHQHLCLSLLRDII